MGDTFLGFDFSTQQIKAVVTDSQGKSLLTDLVHFDSELPQYKTRDGVIRSEDGLRITSPVEMWLHALDLLLAKLQSAKLDFGRIKALSGAGQQHGSVYWALGASQVLKALDSKKTLLEQLKFEECFARSQCPIWMDSSTEAQCRRLEEVVGGPKALCELTGSKAFHRFTGNQIAKIVDEEPEVYDNTERISLVSSFACSLFAGHYAPIDLSDGSGMNLLDIRTLSWNPLLLNPDGKSGDLAHKLAAPSSTKSEGCISPYFVERYGFSPDCSVVTFTGDNPSSLAGLGLSVGDVGVSMGTSDTVFVWSTDPITNLGLHLLVNPINKDQFFAMLCFKNGSLTRERVRKNCGCADWTEFNALLIKTPAGNNGNIGMYFDFPEILPNLPAGDHRFNARGEPVDAFSAEVEARAVIEQGCLAKRAHAHSLGLFSVGRVVVTGGASANLAILQVIADVFQAPVLVSEDPNSAALGGALRAQHQVDGRKWEDFIASVELRSRVVAKPDAQTAEIYASMAERYTGLEKQIIEKTG